MNHNDFYKKMGWKEKEIQFSNKRQYWKLIDEFVADKGNYPSVEERNELRKKVGMEELDFELS